MKKKKKTDEKISWWDKKTKVVEKTTRKIPKIQNLKSLQMKIHQFNLTRQKEEEENKEREVKFKALPVLKNEKETNKIEGVK